jgi:hypothetical protein
MLLLIPLIEMRPEIGAGKRSHAVRAAKTHQ